MYTLRYMNLQRNHKSLAVSFLAVGSDCVILVYIGQYIQTLLGHALTCSKFTSFLPPSQNSNSSFSQDIYVGLAFASFLLCLVVPLADLADFFLLSSPLAPMITITLSGAAVYFYPGSDRWTPARGDTTVILGCYLGTQLGAWCNFQLGILKGPPLPPPYPILWPTYQVYGQTLLRMILGAVVLIATRAIAKPIVHYVTSYLIGADPEEMKRVKPDINNKPKLITELSTKFFVYLAVGFNCIFTAPVVFRAIGCERATFHTEV